MIFGSQPTRKTSWSHTVYSSVMSVCISANQPSRRHQRLRITSCWGAVPRGVAGVHGNVSYRSARQFTLLILVNIEQYTLCKHISCRADELPCGTMRSKRDFERKQQCLSFSPLPTYIITFVKVRSSYCLSRSDNSPIDPTISVPTVFCSRAPAACVIHDTTARKYNSACS